MTFAAPNDFVPPEGTGDDAEFEALGTFKIVKGGKLMLVAVDGKPLKGPEKKEERQDTGFKDAVMGAMRGGAPGM
jgi:hypothetical protein